MGEGQELTDINHGALTDASEARLLPPILEGCYTLSVERRVNQFILVKCNVPDILRALLKEEGVL